MTYCLFCNTGADPVKAARRLPLSDVGQICKLHRGRLDRAVKRGELDKAIAGSCPRAKMTFARPGFKFESHRRLCAVTFGFGIELTSEEWAYLVDWQQTRKRSLFDCYAPKPFATL